MEGRVRQIVALGGGGFSMEPGNPLMDAYLLDLIDRPRPRLCFLPSASGDADHYVVRFYRHFGAHRCEASHISLFRRECGVEDLRAHLLAQDVIYVGGGSVISLLGVWRAHGLDAILREAWESGVVLCGLSAGSLCWFSEGVTAFHGAPQRVEGLGLLPYSNTVHYDGEPNRRTAFHQFVREGMTSGYAVDDGAAVHFAGAELHRVVSSKPRARAYRVGSVGGEVVETPLAADYLGAPVTPNALAA
jgi:dipeptidase E